MRSIHDVLRDSHQYLPGDLRAALAPLFADEDLLAGLSTRLLVFARQGVPDRPPPPSFSAEVTPPLGGAFAPFRPALAAWHEQPDAPDIPAQLAAAIVDCGEENLLVLLGQRRTPASLIGAAALPPPRARLLATALQPYSPADRLSVAARALAKHAPRSSGTFWGTITGGPEDRNAAAAQVLRQILEQATWWNVFGHYKHDRVFEARVESGHGARWGQSGETFIGFLEPFREDEKV